MDKRERLRQKELKDYLVPALLLLAVVCLGLFAINQTFEYVYRVHFLKAPCDLCQELNPQVKDCFNIESDSGYNFDNELKEKEINQSWFMVSP